MLMLRRLLPHWSAIFLTASLLFCAAVLLSGKPPHHITTAGQKMVPRPMPTGDVSSPPPRLREGAQPI
jgi:hypothetical protein